MHTANEKRWRDFWVSLQGRGDPEPHWRNLATAYSESWRHYHNLIHIGNCLIEFRCVRQFAKDPLAIEAAIWFHDVIYDTHRNDNEERSADFSNSILQAAGKAHAFQNLVHSLILATKHASIASDSDARLLADIDLSILGQNQEVYADFEHQIRNEYAWVGDVEFSTGRSTILKSFLARPVIYSNAYFVEKYETVARRNLDWAIKRLVL